jgi:hypothetical protein
MNRDYHDQPSGTIFVRMAFPPMRPNGNSEELEEVATARR